jgi:hypothetical protein
VIYAPILGVLACKKDDCENKSDFIPQFIINYFVYPKGKYWILRNDQNQFDTITVRNSEVYRFSSPYPRPTSNRDRTPDCKFTRDKIVTLFHVNFHEIGLNSYIAIDLEGINNIEERNNSYILARVLDSTDIKTDFYRRHYVNYNQTNNLWNIQPGKVESIALIVINGTSYTNSLQFHRVGDYYDSLCIAPSVGIIRYYRNNKMYNLYETN